MEQNLLDDQYRRASSNETQDTHTKDAVIVAVKMLHGEVLLNSQLPIENTLCAF